MKILVGQFTSPLIYILLIAAVVTALLEEVVDSVVILTVVALNAVIGFFQEYQAEKSVRALKKLVVPKARVVRDGQVALAPVVGTAGRVSIADEGPAGRVALPEGDA